MSDNLRKNVEETIEQYRMLSPGDRVLVALSGGPDSVCLLDTLERLRSKYSITLFAAHFNHKLRGEASDLDAEFAETVANQKGVGFVSSSADVRAFAKDARLSIEAAGRKLRYDFFLQAALSVGASKIALGHTADDQAETMLMRLFRGAGPGGLTGIPPVRPLTDSERAPVLIRPLINAWRDDIMRCIRARKLEYREDASNKSLEYMRNRIRIELLPQLQRDYNPQVKKRLVSVAAALALENDFIRTEAGLLARELVIELERRWLVFNARFLATLHPALRKRIVGVLVSLTEPGSPMLDTGHYEQTDALLASARGKMELPGGLIFEISEGMGLIAGTEKIVRSIPAPLNITIGGDTSVPFLDLIVKTKIMETISSPTRLVGLCNSERQYFDLATVRPPLEIRFRRSGDMFSPLGVKGTKKLKDFFIDKGVPRFFRDRVPLLLSNGRIMWVMGYAIDRKFRLRQGSKAALRVDYEKRATRSTA